MKKRMLSFTLALVLVFSLLPVSALAAKQYGQVPIYIGYADVDYMAEEILKQIPTAGKSDRDKIAAVYDWIVRNCKRSDWDGKYYFDEATVDAQADVFYETCRDALARGEIVLRQEFKPVSGAMDGGMFWLDFDSNQYIASFAYDMMYMRCGNCAHFSSLLAVLLGHLGYDCRLIDGEFINRNGSRVEHKWNYVMVDGSYYWLDVRMDHATYSGGAVPHNYFMQADTKTWATRHAWDQTYSTWIAANTATVKKTYNDAITVATEGPWSLCSNWAKEYMKRAGEMGLIPDSLWGQPLTNGISRQEFAAVAVNLYEALSGERVWSYGSSPFSDTWDPYVIKAYELGVIKGVGEGTFAPDRILTREQAVTMLGRVCELVELGRIEDGTGLDGGELDFTDSQRIAGYARPYVAYFVDGGMISGMGDGTFAPTANMTREQAIKVAVETVEALG